jgi:trigger factor
MAVTVETLEKLERKITLSLPVASIQSEVDSRLKRLARTVKMDGFRPGKVPMSVVAQRYGYSVQYEVLNDKVGEAFSLAANEANLRVAGQPRITEKDGAPEGQVTFDAVFEVFPEVTIGDLSTAEVEKLSAEVTDSAIDKTVEILRKQRRTFAQRAQGAAAEDGDRVTVDFEGKIDGEPFQGGKDVAGKTADFLVTVKKIEAAHLPEVNEQLAKSLGIADGTVEGLRTDIKKNLEREVKFRLLARNKQAVMEALLSKAELELPNASVQAEVARLLEAARADLKQRGIKDADKAEIPEDVFRPQAERRVRLGLVVAELVRANELQAKPEQLKAHIDELAASYEKPEEVVRWYFGDRQRLAEVEAVVIENNVAEFVLGKAKVNEKAVSFDELMGQQG